MVESSVLFPVASVSSLEENWTSVLFSCSGDYYLIRQTMPPPSQFSISFTRSCRNTMERNWLQADRRVTVDDKPSASALAGFSSVQMAPIQKGGAASSTDVAEPLPNTAEADRTSEESVPIEQGQPLRAVEQPSPETPTQRQRDIHELTHLRRFFGVQHACLEKPLISASEAARRKKILAWSLLRLIIVTFQQRSVCSTRS